MSLIKNVGGLLLKPVIKQMSKSRLPELDGNIVLDGIQENIEIIH